LRRLVDQNHPQLSVRHHCELLGLPKSTLYYKPVPVKAETLRIMARINAWYLEDPASGSCRMVDYLAADGIEVRHDRARNLLRRMGLRAVYPKPRTTIPGDPSERFPTLVELDKIKTPDEVWATDITYIPVADAAISIQKVKWSRCVSSSADNLTLNLRPHQFPVQARTPGLWNDTLKRGVSLTQNIRPLCTQ